MSATIRIPTLLRTLCGGSSTVAVDAETVGSALDELDGLHPGFSERLFDTDGRLRRHVNVFVDEEDIRHLQGLATTLPPDTTISIIPAIAGG